MSEPTQATKDDPVARLVLDAAGDRRDFILGADHALLGRAAACHIVLGDETVSRSHARIERQPGGGFSIEDLGTPNGTFVNGTRVQRTTLADGDTIGLGKSTLRFEGTTPASPDFSTIGTEADLDTVLSEETVTVQVNNASEPSLVIHQPNKTWEVSLAAGALTVGRHPSNDIVIATSGASRKHALVERRAGTVVIRDLGTSNGTWVNRQRVSERVLEDGDTIRIADAQLVFRSGVASAEQTLADLTDTTTSTHRPVVMVPGFMGTELWQGSEQIWPNLKTLFVRPEPLAVSDKRSLEPRRVVQTVVIVPNLIKLDKYVRLGNYLEEGLGYTRGKNLLEFGYDWRQDNRASARSLGAAIDAWQKRSRDAQGPITIIAHSMGSLVSRYYLEHLGGKDKVERIIFLGGPHHGVPKAISALYFGPKALPFGDVGERLRQTVSTFPSIYQLLPTYSCAIDQAGERFSVLRDEMWLSEQQRAMLRDAKLFRKEIGTRVSVPAVCVFGYGIKTITSVSVHRNDAHEWQKVTLAMRRNGDDMIPEASALLKGADIHPVRQNHGALYTDSDVKMRLKLELTRGSRRR
jgi:pSer/pThr/pTyr-binding forkhead associated (FHA) protein